MELSPVPTHYSVVTDGSHHGGPYQQHKRALVCSTCNVHPRQGFSVPDKAVTDAPNTAAPAPTTAPNASATPGGGSTPSTTTADPKKPAAAKGKAKAKANPKATWDVRKAKLSTLDSTPFPLVDRPETKRLLETAVLGKAGAHAKLAVQLRGHSASERALDDLAKAKDALEAAYEDVKNVPQDAEENIWSDAMKACARMYIYYGSKEDVTLPAAVPEVWRKRIRIELLIVDRVHILSLAMMVMMRLKRAAKKLFQRAVRKKPRPTVDLRDVPAHLTNDWHGYSRLEHIAETPMASTVLNGLNKKGADINWLCRDVCGAAVKEGSKFFSDTCHVYDTIRRCIPPEVEKRAANGGYGDIAGASSQDTMMTRLAMCAIPGHLLVSRAKFPKATTTVDAIMKLLAADLEFCQTMKNLAVPPPIVDLPGFSNALIFDDTLHVAWRGFAADFLASSLINIFGKGAALQKACDMAGLRAKARGYSLSIDEFSLSEERFSSLNAKGYEIKLLCVWLAA
ncbi:unnamed protein product [Symbiodinium sp. CCMP2592]|nr:unnamed protein product [Symbiodinium sp. CCMP2592]